MSWLKLTCVFSLGAILRDSIVYYNIFFCNLLLSNTHPKRLHLSPRYGHVTLVSGFLVLTAVNWREYPMSFSWCEPLSDLMFPKLAWLKAPYCSGTVVVVGDSTRPWAIPLAMLTMKRETLGFHNFYAWLSSVSSISIGMEVLSPALWAGEALHAIKKNCVALPRSVLHKYVSALGAEILLFSFVFQSGCWKSLENIKRLSYLQNQPRILPTDAVCAFAMKQLLSFKHERPMANYEIKEGLMTAEKDLVKHAKQ